MKDVFKAVKVTDSVWWVGAIDWSIRNFHGYETSRGTTYNAYLVIADKVTLIDTVKAGFGKEMLARIASVIDPQRIDYLVSNHSELDHSGSILETLEAIKPEKVFASAMGAKALAAHFDLPCDITVVPDGEQLDLGGKTITFAETKMCHWPDSMVSYLHEDKVLFSQDAFGMHLATREIFDDQCNKALLEHEAAKYYANILLPLSLSVSKAIKKLSDLGIECNIIAPDHGPVWRSDPKWIMDAYTKWATQPRTNKAVILYDTMWGSTDLMARAVGEGLAEGGATVKLMHLSSEHRSNVAAEILDAGALIVGSPTINNQVYPSLADCLSYLKGLRPIGMVGGVFGSFGWGGGAAKSLVSSLEKMSVELLAEPISSNYVPDSDVLGKCYDLGQLVARRIT